MEKEKKPNMVVRKKKEQGTWTDEDREKSTAIQKEKMRTKKEEILKRFKGKMGNVSALCKGVVISRQTFYRWMEEDEEFRMKIKEEEEALLDLAESKLMKLIKDENLIAILFYLKTKGKKRGYIEAQKHMMIGEEEGEPMRIEFVRAGKKKEKKEEEKE